MGAIQPNSYLIRGAEVLDGLGNPALKQDVRIKNGIIQELGQNLPNLTGESIFEAENLILTPGLIDLHVHVFAGMGLYSLDPWDIGLHQGVTTLIDAGTAGAHTYSTFHRFIIPLAQETVYTFLNISLKGVLHGNPNSPPCIGTLNDIRYADVPSAIKCVEKYREQIIGIKALLTSIQASEKLENEEAGLTRSIEVAEATGLPCMFHHAMSKVPFAQLNRYMRPGDIFTHLFHPNEDSPFSRNDHSPGDELLKARDKGVIMDVGHGVGAFSWRTAESACKKYDFWPDTISSDLHKFNKDGPVCSLVTTMNKFLYLGMPLTKIIQCVTRTPAKAIRLYPKIGSIQPGASADISLFQLSKEKLTLQDSCGETRETDQGLKSAGCFKSGIFREPGFRQEAPASSALFRV